MFEYLFNLILGGSFFLMTIFIIKFLKDGKGDK